MNNKDAISEFSEEQIERIMELYLEEGLVNIPDFLNTLEKFEEWLRGV